MNRTLALIGALLLSLLSIAAACAAAPPHWIHFTLEPERGGDRIEASFRSVSKLVELKIFGQRR